MGPQFLAAIQPSLEEKWSDDVESAWILLFKHISYNMKSAMLQEATEQQQKAT